MYTTTSYSFFNIYIYLYTHIGLVSWISRVIEQTNLQATSDIPYFHDLSSSFAHGYMSAYDVVIGESSVTWHRVMVHMTVRTDLIVGMH